MIDTFIYCSSCAYRNGFSHCRECRLGNLARPSGYRKANTVFVQATSHSGFYTYAKHAVETGEAAYNKAERRRKGK